MLILQFAELVEASTLRQAQGPKPFVSMLNTGYYQLLNRQSTDGTERYDDH
jgi:hypothetical protein